ncbi:two-component response regulator 24-like [Cicer arietinum]|uniref:Two-component response regulator 24-like n=1 Tax=Cicer arietinum TaxID=3827 RepID=A0A1S3E2F6_CICAR|nr:two-component response regulator 24-like [Cicer arietinum]XP_012569369.1 two-component response regulator 24-like [Cicer arietinum]
MEGEDPVIPHGIKALVVDGDDNTRKSHEDMLKSLGVETQSVKNGREAIDTIFEWRRDEYKFDLILMDRRMPVMDGIEATRILRLFDYPSRIVGVSTPLTDAEWEEFFNAGLDDLYDDHKPLSLQTIISICKSVPPPCNGTCHCH